MAKNELGTKGTEQLIKEVSDTREKLRVIRFGGAGSRSRNVKEGRNLRRDVARMLTELRARVIAEKVKKA
ncbi:MAG TPA: 50S ribosomal protein L29 [Candidatus Paceibacterota bacterium]|nr:50S ribosomal protein L29 [Candidatus Paceibacterota bacterium]